MPPKKKEASGATAAPVAVATLVQDKETKRTMRFNEEADENGAVIVGTLYVPKTTLASIGNPTTIQVTLAPVS